MTVPFKKIAESLSEVLPVDLANDVKKECARDGPVFS